MKKKGQAALCSLLLFGGFFGSEKDIFLLKNPVKEKFTVGADYDTVCVKGDLSSYYDAQKNWLPQGFWGNEPQAGIAEIGGKAGDPKGESVPLLSIGKKDTFLLAFTFESLPKDFSDATGIGEVGYELRVRTPEGTLVDSYLKYERRFSDLFLTSGSDYLVAKGRGDILSSFLTCFLPAKSIQVSVSLEAGWQIESFRLYYADKPEVITNASFCHSYNDITSYVEAVHSGTDCSAKRYTKELGTSPTYHLKSQYGTTYSRNYLLDSFVARDRYDDSEIHADTILDPDNYFSEGARAALGTKYTLTLTAKDKAGNVSAITLILEVSDTKAPTLLLRNPQGITVSYASDFTDSAFLSRHFVITDNCDDSPVSKITLEDGKSLPEKEIGDFKALLTSVDRYGNEAKLPFALTLKDDVAPVLLATQSEVYVTPEKYLSEEKLLSFFTAEDEIDGSLPIQVEKNTYTGNEKTLGTYVFEVSAADQSGNIARASLTLHVQDTEGPVWFSKESFLTVVEGEVPSLEEVADALVRQNVVPKKSYVSYAIVEGEKLDNSLSVGLHTMKMRLSESTEDYEDVLLTVKVVKKEDSGVSEEKKLTLWEQFVKWLESLWAKIVQFFTGKKE
jgi:hypothetical protein